MIQGWYYLHTNGDLIYKPDMDGTEVADIRESNFARGLWAIDTEDRESFWSIVVESFAAGANEKRVQELAKKWQCDDEDAKVYAERIGAKLFKDGTSWCATKSDFKNLQESPAGFGEHAYEALGKLCKILGYTASKMWGPTFKALLAPKVYGCPQCNFPVWVPGICTLCKIENAKKPHIHGNNGIDDACKYCGLDLRNLVHTTL